jgi:hypothetical protein
MSNSIRTPIQQPRTTIGGWFKQALKDVFSDHTPPAPKEKQADTYSATPVSVAMVRRAQSVVSGRGIGGPTQQARSAPSYSQDEYLAMCDEIGKIDIG